MDRSLAPDDGGAAEVLYECYRERETCPPKEAFIRALGEWELAYVMIDGQRAGVATRRRGKVHIGILPPWRGKWASRRFIRTIVEWAGEGLPSLHMVWTGTAPDNTFCRQFIERCGFRHYDSEPKGVFYAYQP